MKKTFGGIRYNTETAHLIGAARCDADEWTAWEASLYVTRRHWRYFLAGSGGPMSRFTNRHGEQYKRIEDMHLIDARFARVWAKVYLPKGSFEQYFP